MEKEKIFCYSISFFFFIIILPKKVINFRKNNQNFNFPLLLPLLIKIFLLSNRERFFLPDIPLNLLLFLL